MAKSKAKETKNESFRKVEGALTGAEAFVEKHYKLLLICLAVILIVPLGIVGYNNLIRAPRIQESYSEAFRAEAYFEQDSFNLALNGDGTYPGFLDIIDEYGSLPVGNASKYYAGVCYMRLGQYEDAIDMFNKFDSDDMMVGAMSLNLIGDANMELGNKEEALKYYLKAERQAKNDFLSPIFLMKAGRTCELLGDYKQALEIYKRVETECFGTQEQREIEKYIKRVELKQ